MASISAATAPKASSVRRRSRSARAKATAFETPTLTNATGWPAWPSAENA
jgi:hypothetical protein